MMRDLVGRAELNGCFGACLEFDGVRYTVEVDNGGGQVRLKPINVVAVPAPPPRNFRGQTFSNNL